MVRGLENNTTPQNMHPSVEGSAKVAGTVAGGGDLEYSNDLRPGLPGSRSQSGARSGGTVIVRTTGFGVRLGCETQLHFLLDGVTSLVPGFVVHL